MKYVYLLLLAICTAIVVLVAGKPSVGRLCAHRGLVGGPCWPLGRTGSGSNKMDDKLVRFGEGVAQIGDDSVLARCLLWLFPPNPDMGGEPLVGASFVTS